MNELTADYSTPRVQVLPDGRFGVFLGRPSSYGFYRDFGRLYWLVLSINGEQISLDNYQEFDFDPPSSIHSAGFPFYSSAGSFMVFDDNRFMLVFGCYANDTPGSSLPRNTFYIFYYNNGVIDLFQPNVNLEDEPIRNYPTVSFVLSSLGGLRFVFVADGSAHIIELGTQYTIGMPGFQ